MTIRRGTTLAACAALCLLTLLGGRAAQSAPAACTLAPQLRDVTVNQGLGSYPRLVRGKETLVRFYLSLPSCAARTASIQVTGGTLAVRNGTTPIATVQAPTPVPTSTFPSIPGYAASAALDSPGDPKFVVPGTLLNPASPAGAFTASFSATIAYRTSANTTGSVTFATLPTGGAITKDVTALTNPLRVLVVPMGNASSAFDTQFPASARTAVETGMLTLSRTFPVRDGVGDLSSTTAGLRYAINPTLLDVGANRFCGTGGNFNAIKGVLAQYLQSWNTANPTRPADRVLGVVSSSVSNGGEQACAEGMASTNSPESWVRAIPDGQAPSMTGALMAMEIGHTMGLVPPARSDGAFHSININADGTAPNRAYNVSARSFLVDDHTVMTLSTPWNNTNTIYERDDYADLVCKLGGPTTSTCTAAATVGTAGADPTFVISGTTDGTPAGTHVVESYFSTNVPRSPASPTSPYRLVFLNGSTTVAQQNITVSFAETLHDHAGPNEGGNVHIGLFSAAVPFNTSANRVELRNGSTVLYSRTRAAQAPVVNSVTVGGGAGGTPTNYTEDPFHEDGAAAVSPDGNWIAWEHQSKGNRVVIAPADDSSQKTFLNDAHDPAWSPDGTQLAYISEAPDWGSVFKVTVDTSTRPATLGTPVEVYDTGLIDASGNNPDWSPDGTKIAFDANGNVYTVPSAGGGSATQLTFSDDASNPSWSRTPGDPRLAYERSPFSFFRVADLTRTEASAGSRERSVHAPTRVTTARSLAAPPRFAAEHAEAARISKAKADRRAKAKSATKAKRTTKAKRATKAKRPTKAKRTTKAKRATKRKRGTKRVAPARRPAPIVDLSAIFGLPSADRILAMHAPGAWGSHGPDGGNVASVAAASGGTTNAYAATRGSGIWSSSDGGATWSHGGPYADSRAVAVSPASGTTAFAALLGGLYRTTDGGATWVLTSLPADDVRAVAVSSTTVLAAAAGSAGFPGAGGIWKSTDGGANWIHATGLTDAATSFSFDPSAALVAYAGTQGSGVYKTTDGGDSWTAVNTGLPFLQVQDVEVDPGAPSTVWAALGNVRVAKSTDGGANWAAANGDLPASGITATDLAAKAGTVYLSASGTPGGLWKTTNGGTNWTGLTSGLPGDDQSDALWLDPSAGLRMLAGMGAGGIYRSADGGDNWTPSSTGMHATVVPALATAGPGALYAAANSQGAHVWKSLDSAETWATTATSTAMPAFNFVNALAVDPTSPTTVYASLASWNIYKTTNGGTSWTNPGSLPGGATRLAVDPITSANVYAATNGGVRKSPDGGATWNPASAGIPAGPVPSIALDPATPTTAYAGHNTQGVYKSTDGGDTFSPSSTGIGCVPGCTIWDIAVDTTSPNVVYASSTSAVYMTTSSGGLWTSISTGLPAGASVYDLEHDPAAPATLYAATSQGVYKTTNQGTSWAPMAGLPVKDTRAVEIDPGNHDRILVATLGGGVFSLTQTLGPQTFVVNTTDGGNDGECTLGHCSLREAVGNANANPGADTITFDIPGSATPAAPHVIALPVAVTITDPVEILGGTQPGYSGTPVVALNGEFDNPTGVVVTAGGTRVQGLALYGFADTALELVGAGGNVITQNYVGLRPDGTRPGTVGDATIRVGREAQPTTDNTISFNRISELLVIEGDSTEDNDLYGNVIGLDAAGTGPANPGSDAAGILIENAPNNRIGRGLGEGEENVISGFNVGSGVEIRGGSADGNAFVGNLIGTTVNGDAPVRNGVGLLIHQGADRTEIGGDGGDSDRNVISGNQTGVIVMDGDGTVFNGNFIGTADDGVTSLSNTFRGVEVRDGADFTAVGGTLEGAGNVIAYNGVSATGVAITGGAFTSVLGNSIFDNAGLGIDLGADGVTANDGPGDPDTGPNGLQNFPVIESVTPVGDTVAVEGELLSTESTDFRIEFFASAGCDEGKRYVGAALLTTNVDGFASFDHEASDVVVEGEYITATATAVDAELGPLATSEFSACVLVEPTGLPPVSDYEIWTLDPTNPDPESTAEALLADGNPYSREEDPSWDTGEIAYTYSDDGGDSIRSIKPDKTDDKLLFDDGERPSLVNGILAFDRLVASGVESFSQEIMLVRGGSAITVQVTSPQPQNLRLDIFLNCDGTRYPIAVGLTPKATTASGATFEYRYDPALACANGTIEVFAADGFLRSAPSTQAQAPLPSGEKPPAAAIYVPYVDLRLLQYSNIPLFGGGDDPDDGALTGNALQWTLTGPMSRTGSGPKVDLTPPAGGWTPGNYTAQLVVTDGDGNTDTATMPITILQDEDNDGVPALVEPTGCNGRGDNDPTNAYEDTDGDGISNLDEAVVGTDLCAATPQELAPSTANFDPNTLNLSSTGTPVTVYVSVPGRSVAQITPGSVRITKIVARNVTYSAATDPAFFPFTNLSWTAAGTTGAAKFERQPLIDFLNSKNVGSTTVRITIEGSSPLPPWRFSADATFTSKR